MIFEDRNDAGKQLAAMIGDRVGGRPLVLALPRGGVPVAGEVADALNAPLDVIGVRKIGAPGHPELGVGAVAEGGGLVLDQRILGSLGIQAEDVADTVEAERREVRRRADHYREGRPLPDMAGRTVVIVDDGLATGVTARAAVRAVRSKQPAEIVLAVPVCSSTARDELAEEADSVVCVATPEQFRAVGLHYRDFAQTTDEQVMQVLKQRRDRTESGQRSPDDVRDDIGGDDIKGMAASAAASQPVVITIGAVQLDGDLTLPGRASGIVVFAHGSGSSRHSPRNRQVAADLNDAGLGTLLFDLLTHAEDQLDRQTRELRFDVGLLAQRLVGVTEWLAADETTRRLRVGYFGASTGAAAALVAATQVPDRVGPIVSRGGRPDLAGDALERVSSPVLLIVGGADTQVIELNHQAAGRLRSEVEVQIVPGASHLFEEPGALEQVSDLARLFFTRHMPPTS